MLLGGEYRVQPLSISWARARGGRVNNGLVSGNLSSLSALRTFLISVTTSDFPGTLDGFITGTYLSALGNFLIFGTNCVLGVNLSGVTLFDYLYREDLDI